MIKSLLTALFCIVFMTVPVLGSNLKRESKEECCICHVLWFDSLAKGAKTLLESTDSPIVIQGSPGLASSREMCYSCHEGYVADSRNTIIRGNKHQLIGKVPEGLKLPDIFRLTKNNEFYCGTCHGLHDVRAMGEVGKTPFTRMDNDRSQMCIACHPDKMPDKMKAQKFPDHPLMVSAKRLPLQAIRKKGPKFGPENEIICQSCHTPHGKRAMVAPVENSAVCVICHTDNARLFGTKHDLRITMPAGKNLKKQSVSVSGPCGGCHIPHSPSGPILWARDFKQDGSLSQMCLSCHDPKKPEDEIKGTGTYSHPIDVIQISAKNGPVPEAAIPDLLPLFSKNGDRQPGGTVQCSTCHNPHQWDPGMPESRGGKDMDGDASNSFLRMPSAGASRLCLECHRDKYPLLSYDHNLKLTAPGEKNIQGQNVNLSGPCGACHMPHHAAGPKLWARKIDENKAQLPQYCLGCHNENGPARKKTVGKYDHPVDVASRGFHIAVPARVSKKLPLYSQNGKVESGDTIRCFTCHDPHIWMANSMSQPTGSDASEDTSDPAAKNLEGDARNSFLRQPASPDPDLCVVCHEETVFLMGTDHDLFITAPTARNWLGQSVNESGPCGACHAVHKSPNALKLWARALPSIGENQPFMNALCISCHSKGEVAENKIPHVATHPEGMLITNIMRSNDQRKGYTPIFDDKGQEVSVGDLSCSSCHSYYLWDPRIEGKGPYKNVEGDAETSFLRTIIDHTVCSDCHGEEAIWRYTYFHSIQKRKILKLRQ